MKHPGRIVAADQHDARLAFALAAAFALFCIFINPVGYVGAGADDEHYLAAARCWIEQGLPCRPPNHWWTRWPAFAPVALSTALLGESRFTVSIGPFVYWTASMAAIGMLGTLWFNARAGALAVAILAATPAVAVIAIDPTADTAELCFQLSALVAATFAFRRHSPIWAIVAGIAAGLALESRDTSAVFIAVSALAWLFLDSHRRRVLLWAIAGLAAVTIADMAIYGFATGDPLLRYRLALGHVGVPTDALPEGFDTSQSPLLNPSYIRAWKREVGITMFWPLDPWINLLATPRIRSVLWFLLAAVLLYRQRLSPTENRVAFRLLLAAALWAVLLVYGLAIDPKSRMFLPLAAAAALVGGALVAAAWRSGSQLPAATLLLMHLTLGIYAIDHHAASAVPEARARHWLAAFQDRIEITRGARSYLTLIPGVRTLPADQSGHEMVILNSVKPCDEVAGAQAGGPRLGRVVDYVQEPNAQQSYLCLIAYTDAYYRERNLVRR